MVVVIGVVVVTGVGGTCVAVAVAGIIVRIRAKVAPDLVV